MLTKQRTSSLSPPESVKPFMVGFGDYYRDWLLLGRRGSGALELLAGLWRHNRDRSERSSFDSDDSFLSVYLKTDKNRMDKSIFNFLRAHHAFVYLK